MAEEYLTDDEQLEHVKRLVAEYGPWTHRRGGRRLGIRAFGYRYYNQHMNERALDASAQFADMSAAVQRNDRAKARQIADGLIKDYPSSPYADQAQLALARLDVDEGQEARAVASAARGHGAFQGCRAQAHRAPAPGARADRSRQARRGAQDAFGPLQAPSPRVTTRCAAMPITPRRTWPRPLEEYKAALGEGDRARAWTRRCSH